MCLPMLLFNIEYEEMSCVSFSFFFFSFYFFFINERKIR